MAERSKALDLGSSLFGGVGSNPTLITFSEAFVCRLVISVIAGDMNNYDCRPEFPSIIFIQ